MKRHLAALAQGLVAGTGLLAAPAAMALNLVTNGDFETPDVLPQPGYQCFQNTARQGWASSGSRGSCYIQQNTDVFGSAYSGQQFMYLNDFGAQGIRLSQSVLLQAGTTYELTFALGSAKGFSTSTLQVSLGSFVANLAPQTEVWTLHSYHYKALATGLTQLSFLTTSTGVSDIDGVRVEALPVPEPGTYALMLAGLVGIGAVARRRR